MRKIFAVIVIFISFFACDKKDQKQNDLKENNTKSNNYALGTLIRWDTLFISARFDECGEWGGHKEILEIFKKEKDIYLNYKRNNVNCNKVDDIYNTKVFSVKEIKLNNQHQNAIKEYVYQLLQNKINEGYHEHSGKAFNVLKGDSTFFINVYDNNPKNPILYNSLLKELNLK